MITVVSWGLVLIDLSLCESWYMLSSIMELIVLVFICSGVIHHDIAPESLTKKFSTSLHFEVADVIARLWGCEQCRGDLADTFREHLFLGSAKVYDIVITSCDIKASSDCPWKLSAILKNLNASEFLVWLHVQFLRVRVTDQLSHQIFNIWSRLGLHWLNRGRSGLLLNCSNWFRLLDGNWHRVWLLVLFCRFSDLYLLFDFL